uniref:Uncharacterized protein n=1 Tax=Siphoviridae sp. ctbbV81 TaxID=2827900 RepID=A0A8S5TQL8_9CAUD|nr:MAG TPA: hypothetical protein [Siphoviridae sp. ctbbV81]
METNVCVLSKSLRILAKLKRERGITYENSYM